MQFINTLEEQQLHKVKLCLHFIISGVIVNSMENGNDKQDSKIQIPMTSVCIRFV